MKATYRFYPTTFQPWKPKTTRQHTLSCCVVIGFTSMAVLCKTTKVGGQWFIDDFTERDTLVGLAVNWHGVFKQPILCVGIRTNRVIFIKNRGSNDAEPLISQEVLGNYCIKLAQNREQRFTILLDEEFKPAFRHELIESRGGNDRSPCSSLG